ncbi:tyrosine phosphatase family-domain-containing protein [Scheffersomyces amazonensis]|uniref:tyrosine phosphatase family-domain-containing protein n=1 Tax=Scheffersomyces amazonensis TaxID=1078765 RepID=UPI00315CD2E6
MNGNQSTFKDIPSDSGILKPQVTYVDDKENIEDFIGREVKLDKYENHSALVTYHPQIQYVPPLNFSLVEDQIYRSGFPMPINYPFLKQLGLKTIIYLGDLGHEKPKKEKKKEKEKSKDKDKEGKKKDKQNTVDTYNNYLEWISTTDITFHNLLIDSSQEPFNKPEEYRQAHESLTKALYIILNKNSFPILIHSNKGKHRTGLLVGLIRKILQGWCISGIFEEYEKFAMGKSEFDLEFIELWQPELWINDELKPDFVRI